jgi:CheY-like chemotaxis protein
MTSKQIQVLIADDKAQWNEAVGNALRDDPERSFSVRTATSVSAALEACEKSPPDVAVLDLNLPSEADGLGLLDTVRRRWPRVKVLLVTEQPGTKIPAGCLGYRPESFLAKPTDFKTAVEQVRREILRIFAEGTDYFKDCLLRALDNWAVFHGVKEPVLVSGGHSYTVPDLKEEILKGSEVGEQFREAVCSVAVQQLSPDTTPASMEPKEIIKEKLKIVEEVLRLAASSP